MPIYTTSLQKYYGCGGIYCQDAVNPRLTLLCSLRDEIMAMIKKCIAYTVFLAGLFCMNPAALSAEEDSGYPWYLNCLMPVVALDDVCRCHPGDGGWTPIQISLTEEAQIFEKSDSVYGLRIDLIHGCNYTVTGFDAGLLTTVNYLYGVQAAVICNRVNEDAWAIQVAGIGNSVDDMYGIQLAGIYNFNADCTGIQVSGITNINEGDFTGLQAGTLFNYCNEMKGIQFSLVNYSSESYGIQTGGLNSGEKVCGIQVGLVNSGENVCGVQIGVFNYAKRMSGVQIGLVNIIEEGGLPFMVFFNASMTFSAD